MYALTPGYAQRIKNKNDDNSLTDAQYATLIQLLALADYEPLTDTEGNLIMKDSGEILYGKI